jgi:hypothetical protein
MHALLHGAHLDDCSSAWLECGANGAEVTDQMFVADSLYHLNTHHLDSAAVRGGDGGRGGEYIVRGGDCCVQQGRSKAH